MTGNRTGQVNSWIIVGKASNWMQVTVDLVGLGHRTDGQIDAVDH